MQLHSALRKRLHKRLQPHTPPPTPIHSHPHPPQHTLSTPPTRTHHPASTRTLRERIANQIYASDWYGQEEDSGPTYAVIGGEGLQGVRV